ncbi:hypothetical protein V500_10362 [Pseudogymnoascus sp. VKM F-4518 (FW-2643)]|nr:hypothetical protein V500_10362 [Pseudogymnoascus sp. VKM F-4518 (FW-2643)]
MASPRVLLFGGSGGLGRAMTELMLTKSWQVTSVVRDSKQTESILRLGPGDTSKANVLLLDLESMDDQDASKVLEQVQPNYVIFAAASVSNPNAVDRDSAKKIIKASANNPSITKFLMISFPTSRRKRAPWWTDSDYKQYLDEMRAYPQIANAKIDADEYLVAMAKVRESSGLPFQAISLRPSWLTNNQKGKVHLGKTKSIGQVSRTDVAAVAVSLLSRDDSSGWFDLVEGNDDIEKAVDQVVRDNVNTVEGEDLNYMYRLAA